MEGTEMVRPLNRMPDHDFGGLGQLAHAALADYVDEPPEVPRLHLGQNTLPDPPFPMAMHRAYPVVAGAWEYCGEDLFTFLEFGARSLRTQPRPAGSEFSEADHVLQRLLRVDAIALVWRVRTVQPTESVVSWTFMADALAGRVVPAEIDPAIAPPSLAVWAVDRSGTGILGYVRIGGTADDIDFSTDKIGVADPIIGLLSELLDAQYDWTNSVFGLS